MSPPEPAPIGTARGLPDGSVELTLRAVSGPGAVGDGRFVVKPADAAYAAILKHLGGLAPGEVKPVLPFP